MSLSAVLLAASLALPQPLDAQRAVPRGGGDGGQSSGGGGGQDRGGDRTPTPSPRGGGTSRGSSGGGERRAAPPQTSSPQAAAPRSSTDADDDSAQTRDDNGGSSTSARRRGDSPRTGVAVDRRVRPGGGDGGTIIVPGGWYPWGWGGYGFAGYYGFYDPWYSGYGYGYRGQYYPRRDDGSVRLKVKPRDASVYVDGYYAGTVDDFDGIFQALPLEPGPHRIEMQLDGYAPLTFDVRVLPERKITFEEEMMPIEP